jgi:hypothetical protein
MFGHDGQYVDLYTNFIACVFFATVLLQSGKEAAVCLVPPRLGT